MTPGPPRAPLKVCVTLSILKGHRPHVALPHCLQPEQVPAKAFHIGSLAPLCAGPQAKAVCKRTAASILSRADRGLHAHVYFWCGSQTFFFLSLSAPPKIYR